MYFWYQACIDCPENIKHIITNPHVCKQIAYNYISRFLTKVTWPTSEAGAAYPSGTPEFTTGFLWGSCCSFFSFLCNNLWIIVSLLGHCIVCVVLTFLMFVWYLFPLSLVWHFCLQSVKSGYNLWKRKERDCAYGKQNISVTQLFLSGYPSHDGVTVKR
jgi:hypothetical protein